VRQLGGSGRDKAVLHQHLDPAGRITLDGHSLVVDGAILIGRMIFEHGVDDAEHLVRQGHDGFFVPFADGQRGEFVLQSTATAGGCLSKLT